MPEPQTPPTPPNPESESGTLTMGDLRGIVEDIVTKVAGALTPAAAKKAEETGKDESGRPVDIAAQVRGELEKMRLREAKERDEADLKKTVAELKERQKPEDPKPPIERRRIHKMMGWGEND